MGSKRAKLTLAQRQRRRRRKDRKIVKLQHQILTERQREADKEADPNAQA